MTQPRPLAEQAVVELGASSGIGRAAALEFVGRGVRRIAVASRGVEALDTLVTELTAAGAVRSRSRPTSPTSRQ